MQTAWAGSRGPAPPPAGSGPTGPRGAPERLLIERHPSFSGPEELVLGATDNPLHGQQEGRFFHGYYDSCYLR